ncbi:MAG: AraC family transcriptional regulator [Flammeovirgaceae bacterium]|nr:AraC family transcriptional regulator [Flammeovirgaceae bacterium]
MVDEIKKFKFKVSAKFQVEVVPLHTLTTANKQHLITPHRTDFYHVFLFEDCSPVHLVDFNSIQVKPYTLLFIDKDRVHQFDTLLKYEGSVLIFTNAFFCSTEAETKFLQSTILFNDLKDEPSFQVEKSAFNHFKKICDQINLELQQPDDNSKHDILKNLLHNFLLFAEREKRKRGFTEPKKSADLDYTLLFRDLIEKEFAKLKNVSAYAEQLHVSEKRLGQATLKILGKTPKEIIDERVLLEAKRLLAHSNLSVKEIAIGLGYNEPTYFIRYFRKHVLQTPMEFRENYIH